jgi:hypothetical protein
MRLRLRISHHEIGGFISTTTGHVLVPLFVVEVLLMAMSVLMGCGVETRKWLFPQERPTHACSSLGPGNPDISLE